MAFLEEEKRRTKCVPLNLGSNNSILSIIPKTQATAPAADDVSGWQQPWIQVTTADGISSYTGNATVS